jgi:hypothetical protein
MVEVGIVIKWSTGTLAGRHSFPYIDVVSADEKYILAELGEIIPGKHKTDWDIVEIDTLRQNAFNHASEFTQEYLSDRAYARQAWQMAQEEKYK